MAAAATVRPVRHETRALLRAHLAAASGYRHLTRHCVVCHRLLRLAMELPDLPDLPDAADAADAPHEGAEGPDDPPSAV
ncbi:DUF6274 family protein [Streptomyces sp. NPDC093595]|uniref:DUF6274 family protein n=1 Tax=Streptomyces sp. NPDC093595 TaxID=3366045 RepID=UPI00380C1E88